MIEKPENSKQSKRGGKRPGSGRPKGARNKVTAEIRELAQPYAPEAITTLTRIMRRGESDAARVAAAKEILDRAFGKAAQTVHSTGESVRYVIEVPAVAATAEEWLARRSTTNGHAAH